MREGKKEEEIDGVRRERESKREKKRDRETHTQRNRECSKQLRNEKLLMNFNQLCHLQITKAVLLSIIV